MTATSRPRLRTILRFIHVLAALPLVAYVYGPSDVAEQLQLPLRAVLLPVLAISGLIIWQLPALRRAKARRTATRRS